MKSRIHAYKEEIRKFIELSSLFLAEQNLLHLPAPKTLQTKNVSVSRVRHSLSNIVRSDNIIHATARASDYGNVPIPAIQELSVFIYFMIIIFNLVYLNSTL